MISAVILGLALVAPGFALPLTGQGLTTTGIQGTTGIQDEKHSGVGTGIFTLGEKTGVQGTSEGFSQDTSVRPIGQQGEKTGIHGGGFEGYTDQKTSGVDAVRPILTHEGKTRTPDLYTTSGEKYVETARPVGQTFVQGSPETYNQMYPESQHQVNPAVQKVEMEQVSSDKPQFYLPVQPIYVSPETQGFASAQKLTPVVVPAETIAAGRVIIMAVEPIRQGFIQDVPNPERPYQQVAQQPIADYVQPVESSQQQLFSTQPETIPQVVGYVDKQTPYQQGAQNPIPGYSQALIQGQEPQLIRNQPLVGANPEKQSVSELTQTIEHNQHQLSSGQQVVPSFEKQTSGYTPSQTLETSQTYNPQSSNAERQGSYHTVAPENQPDRLPQQQTYTVSDKVEKQGAQGIQSTGYTQTQGFKSQEVEPNQLQYSSVQPQVAGYVASNFGEKLPQPVQQFQPDQVQSLSAVPYKPEQSVRPAAVVPQQQAQ